jgi:hypothetical protein
MKLMLKLSLSFCSIKVFILFQWVLVITALIAKAVTQKKGRKNWLFIFFRGNERANSSAKKSRSEAA